MVAAISLNKLGIKKYTIQETAETFLNFEV
jgi:hypothetical protein